MIVTSLDLLLLVIVPATVAVLEVVLWRLAVRRLHRRPRTSAAAPAAPPAREARPMAPAPRRLVAHAAGDAAVSPHSHR